MAKTDDQMQRKNTIDGLVSAFQEKSPKENTFPRANLFYILELCNRRFNGNFVRWEYDNEEQTRVRVFEKSGDSIVMRLDES
ncbi:MAG: hypothetical protein IJT34_03830 [Butyrivibrio sp.]|nr:hypothetical protein [Butyrivibrio sp.]